MDSHDEKVSVGLDLGVRHPAQVTVVLEPHDLGRGHAAGRAGEGGGAAGRGQVVVLVHLDTGWLYDGMGEDIHVSLNYKVL